jgi:GxxExxY protein
MRPEPEAQLDQVAHAVIGAAIEVHRILGPGYLEQHYEEALCAELKLRGLHFERQKPVGVDYKGQTIGESRLDLLVANELIVELKAVDALAPIHTAQLISYLKMTGKKLGLLMNFNVPVLKDGIRRVIAS